MGSLRELQKTERPECFATLHLSKPAGWINICGKCENERSCLNHSYIIVKKKLRESKDVKM